MGAWMDLYVKHDGQSFKLQISFKAEAMMIYMYHLCFWSLVDPNATQTPPNTKFLILKFLREAISLHLVVDIDISLWLLKFLILKFLRGHLVFVIGISDTYLYDCWYS